MSRNISLAAVISSIRLKLASSPSSPATGYLSLFSKTDKKAYIKDADGLESKLISGPSTVSIDSSGTINIPTGQTYNVNGSPHSHGGGGVSYASYTVSTTHTVTNNTLSPQAVEIDTETADPSGIASVASNTITISSAGDYEIWLAISVSASSAFNGRIGVYLSTSYTLVYEFKGYATADGIQGDYFFLHTFSQFASNDTITVSIDNHSGFTVTYLVSDLTIAKLG